jgi:hypothetical protein
MVAFMRDPSKAASRSTQRAVFGGLYLVLGTVWFVALSPAVGGAWLALGVGWLGLAWRVRDRNSPPVERASVASATDPLER